MEFNYAIIVIQDIYGSFLIQTMYMHVWNQTLIFPKVCLLLIYLLPQGTEKNMLFLFLFSYAKTRTTDENVYAELPNQSSA